MTGVSITGYFQVLGSFVSFKVRWPDFISRFLSDIQNTAALLKFDMLELPGLACIWSSVNYAQKSYFKVR